jgi:predicted SnoaL-like aldol condensation-catalyzing enzyme
MKPVNMRAVFALVLAATAAAAVMVGVGRASTTEEERNIRTAVAFYQAAMNDKDWQRASSYIGPRYDQHSVYMEDQREGFRKLVERIKRDYPDNHGEILNAFADGDMVVLQVHVRRYAEHLGWSVIEMLRFENGLVVEHWDMFEAVPDKEAEKEIF